MGLADELAKLQQLKLDGVLSDDEFAQAKRKLLEEEAPESTPLPLPPTVNLSLKEGFDEIIDEESSLGTAANRYVDYKYKSHLVSVIVFIIFAIIIAIIFSNVSRNFTSVPGGGTTWQMTR